MVKDHWHICKQRGAKTSFGLGIAWAWGLQRTGGSWYPEECELCSEWRDLQYDTYDTIQEFNMYRKAECGHLNVGHLTKSTM